MNRIGTFCLGLFGFLVAAAMASTPAASKQQPLTEEEAFRIAVEAYIYGCPLVPMEMTRGVITNTATVCGEPAGVVGNGIGLIGPNVEREGRAIRGEVS